MKIQTAKNLACVTLGVSVQELKRATKYTDDALCIVEGKDEERREKFRVMLNENPEFCCMDGALSEVGAKFTPVGDEAVLWICLPEKAQKNKAEYIAEEYGKVLADIQTIEKQVKAAAGKAAAAAEAIMGAITDVDAPAAPAQL